MRKGAKEGRKVGEQANKNAWIMDSGIDYTTITAALT